MSKEQTTSFKISEKMYKIKRKIRTTWDSFKCTYQCQQHKQYVVDHNQGFSGERNSRSIVVPGRSDYRRVLIGSSWQSFFRVPKPDSTGYLVSYISGSFLSCIHRQKFKDRARLVKKNVYIPL